VINISSKNIFKLLIKEIFSLPLWIKQIIYLELKEEFESPAMKSYLNSITKDTCLQLHVPKLTYAGRKELEKKIRQYPEEIYNFLEGAFQGLSVIEIAISNNWNLYECSCRFLDTIHYELVVNPASSIIKGTALYMSGRIRLGEYFVKLDKISIDQLDEALRTQKYIEDSMGDRPGLADILIDSGFLTKEDTEGILQLKKDCREYFKSNILNHPEIFQGENKT
jgi:hypothetical protein